MQVIHGSAVQTSTDLELNDALDVEQQRNIILIHVGQGVSLQAELVHEEPISENNSSE